MRTFPFVFLETHNKILRSRSVGIVRSWTQSTEFGFIFTAEKDACCYLAHHIIRKMEVKMPVISYISAKQKQLLLAVNRILSHTNVLRKVC
jgi:hypothetical protein